MAKLGFSPTNLAGISSDYSLHPFAERLTPLITETLSDLEQDKERRGTKLVSSFVVWLVLALSLRRDLSSSAVLNWMISGWRWLVCTLPKQLVSEGAISHARVRVGVEVFKRLFNKVIDTFKPLPADFYGRISVVFDGSTGTMPDSDLNCQKFGKAKSRRKSEKSAYPQLRWMSLLAVSSRLLLDVSYDASVGKGTGERTLMMKILKNLHYSNLLFLADAGLYSILMMYTIQEQGAAFLVKVSSHPPLPVEKVLPDGSYLSKMKGEIIDESRSNDTQKKWKKVEVAVRVIKYQIPGWRPCRIVTNLLDAKITAKELVIHYHKRWDIEICFDEIKTHQCATLRGKMPTLFRSKRPDLVEQELYAMMLSYNLIREMMLESIIPSMEDPLMLSFLECLQLIIEVIPQLSKPMSSQELECGYDYLFRLISESEIDRPRRKRINDRVVKVKMSKFKRKTSEHKSQSRDVYHSLQIVVPKSA
jgi:hypothetical protein